MLLREKDRINIISILNRLDIPVEVWAYGSRVHMTAHEASDLDLVVRTQDLTPLPFGTVMRLRQWFSDSNIPIIIDIRDWANLPATFHEQIELKYEPLWSNISSPENTSSPQQL